MKIATVISLPTCLVLLVLSLISASAVSDDAAATGTSDGDKVDIEIPTQDGVINTAELRGQVVYIDFWASWCVPCRKSFPWLNTMLEKYEDKGLTVIGINVDRDAAFAAEFLEEVPANFPIGYDPKATLAELFELPAMPSAFIVSREGDLIDAHYGFKTSKTDEYEASIAKALGL